MPFFPQNDFVTVDAVGDLNAIFVEGHHMLVRGLDDDEHFFAILIFKLDGMPFVGFEDLPSRRLLLVLAFLAVGVVEAGNLAIATWLAPKGSHPDREFQVTFLELHPDAGANFRDTEKALIVLAAIRNAGHSPPAGNFGAQHAGDTKSEATKSFWVYVVYDKAPILPVESAFNLLHEVGNDLFQLHSCLLQIRVWLAGNRGKIFCTGRHERIPFGAKELRVALRREGMRHMGDVINAAVRRSHPFDGDRAMRFKNVAVPFSVDLPFCRHKPLGLVKQLLAEGPYFGSAGGGIHSHVHPPGRHTGRQDIRRADGSQSFLLSGARGFLQNLFVPSIDLKHRHVGRRQRIHLQGKAVDVGFCRQNARPSTGCGFPASRGDWKNPVVPST